MGSVRDCPECEQGKHLGCLIEVLDDNDKDSDWWVRCPCAARHHNMKTIKKIDQGDGPDITKKINTI